MGAYVFSFAMKQRWLPLCNIPRMIMTLILPDVKYPLPAAVGFHRKLEMFNRKVGQEYTQLKLTLMNIPILQFVERDETAIELPELAGRKSRISVVQ